MNYFGHPSAAERYARDRPYFHPLVVERIRVFLKLAGPVPVALDVACGTGHSTLALTEIAASIIATDISPAMLAKAPAHPKIRYLEAAAEDLPVETGSVDLATVTLAFHWFDRPRFLAEAWRVLWENGTLVIISHRFHFRMLENPDFTRWFDDHYFPKYPSPPRHDEPLTDAAAQDSGLKFIGRERYTHELTLSPEQLTRNLVTHSNVIAAVEQGTQSLEEVRRWLLESVTALFPASTGTFIFGGEIWYLQRTT